MPNVGLVHPPKGGTQNAEAMTKKVAKAASGNE
jgi:hypothetical protein